MPRECELVRHSISNRFEQGWKLGVVVYWDLRQNQFHWFLRPQAEPHSFVLQQLVVAFKILATPVNFKDQFPVLFYLNLHLEFSDHLPVDVTDELLCASY